MSDSFQKVLHNEDGLEITFIVEEDAARIEFRGNKNVDLSAVDDVVVVVNGKGFEAVPRDGDFSVAHLGSWSALSTSPVQLMIRVHEFFEGWELD